MNESKSRKITLFIFVMLIALLAICMFIGLLMGPAGMNFQTAEGKFILYQIRLPRVIMAVLVGAALSLAGAIFQALLRNPLADPHFLGVSAGGALGVVLGSGLLSGSILFFAMPLLSLLGSLGTVLIVYRLSLRKRALSLYTLLLIGVVLNSLFVSIIVFIQSLFYSDQLTTILFWLLGNLSFASYPKLIFFAFILVIASALVFLKARRLNIISLGESTAHALGVPVESTKKSLFFLGALLTGVAVSMSGMIGFIGLIVPHSARLLFGADYRKLIPASALLGGIVLILSDSLARTIVSYQELPVGVITSFLGAPFFIYFLKKREAKRII